MYKRYAVYYTPEPGSLLAEFGSTWLGWDSAKGKHCAQPDVAGLNIQKITATPRRYGFHGTIKPPFALVGGADSAALTDALEKLCADAAPIILSGLELTRMGGFLALTPIEQSTALNDLAARAVRDLDSFRAPLTDAEIARRRTRRLTATQDAHLLSWGYPHVLDQFQFHMTLTGGVDSKTAAVAKVELAQRLAVLDLCPFEIGSLTLLGEDEKGHFHQIARYPLRG